MFFLRLLIIAVAVVKSAVLGACPAGQTFASANSGYAYVDACAFPTNNLNKTCVSASCPSLATSKLCPFNKSDQSLDSSGVMSQINECFKSISSLCGAQWDPIQFPQNSLQLSFGGLASFHCSLPPTGLTATGLKKTVLTSLTSGSSSSPNTISLSLSSPNVNASGTAQCSFTVLGFPLPFSLPFTGSYTADYSGSATVDARATPPSVNLTSVKNNNSLNMVPPVIENLLPPNILADFNGFIKLFIGNVTDDVAFSTYGATYVAYALQVLRDNC